MQARFIALVPVLLVALTVCSGGPGPIEQGKGSGTLSGWPTGKMGTIKFVVLKVNPSPGDVVSSSKVDANGIFSYDLKEPLDPRAASSMWPENCNGDGTTSPGSFKIDYATIFAQEFDNPIESQITLASSTILFPRKIGDAFAGFLFVDREVIAKGSRTCGSGEFATTNIINAKLAKGWNILVSTITQIYQVNGAILVKEIETSVAQFIPSHIRFFYPPPVLPPPPPVGSLPNFIQFP